MYVEDQFDAVSLDSWRGSNVAVRFQFGKQRPDRPVHRQALADLLGREVIRGQVGDLPTVTTVNGIENLLDAYANCRATRRLSQAVAGNVPSSMTLNPPADPYGQIWLLTVENLDASERSSGAP